MDVLGWVDRRGGIVRRDELARAGFRRGELDRAGIQSVGRQWLALDTAPPRLVEAATRRSRLACVSAADHHGLSLLRRPTIPHFWAPPGARLPSGPPARMHRGRALLAPRPDQLVESLPDLLEHVAGCLPHVEALIVWESAIRQRLVTAGALRQLAWRSPMARTLAAEASSRSDSLLETIVTDSLRHLEMPFRQQVAILGHRVDILVGDRLVVQLEGFTVLRFTYEDVTQRLAHVLDMIRRAMVLHRVRR
ncbi:MAG TPA: DNA helicase [Microbacteriaceae bacterium]|nr:DNA helicase [Microbacteriaceae bacterium]